MQRVTLRVGAQETPAFFIKKDNMSGRIYNDAGIGNTGRAVLEPQGTAFMFLRFQCGNFLFQLLANSRLLAKVNEPSPVNALISFSVFFT
jgi:hypothetical protein